MYVFFSLGMTEWWGQGTSISTETDHLRHSPRSFVWPFRASTPV